MSIVIKIGTKDAGRPFILIEGEETQDSRAKRVADVILPALREHFQGAKIKRIRGSVEVQA